MTAAVIGCSSLATSSLAASPSRAALGMESLSPTGVPRAEPTGELYDVMRESTLGALHQAPVVGGLLSYVGALILPPEGETPEQMWRKYTDRRISETVFNLVQADLEGLTSVSRLYRNAVAAQDLKTIHSQSVSSNTHFSGVIERFKLPAERITLLPLFVVAATLHLALLRDIALKGMSIGFNAESVQSYKTELANRIKAYTLHVDHTVEAAIAKARRDNPNDGAPIRRNEPLSAMLAEKARLQLEAIDLRDTWFAFDAAKYPDKKRVTLLREIFSPIAGWWDLGSRAPDEIPDWKTPGTRINRMEFWVRAQWNTRWLSAVKLYYDQTDETLQTGDIVGDRHEFVINETWIKHAVTSYTAGVARIGLTTNRGGFVAVGRELQGNEMKVSSGYARHKLQSIRSIGKGRGDEAAHDAISGLVYGFGLEQPSVTSIHPETDARIVPVIAPHLIDWIRRPVD
ncbi:insecticidal delta-endotoxin Cry8Ea1 family protein [Stenotrophomonas sp. WHRI 8082]|uniref:insecticidal delta-endotoxin Cry8Ea1 family protein n=1 Tax=Stenotrophomonas sp. WHRI 8082 TaxID=3162571 RepID=UPI0032EE2FDF